MPLKLQKVNMKIIKKYARETVKVPVNKMKKYYMNIEIAKQFPPPTAVFFSRQKMNRARSKIIKNHRKVNVKTQKCP